MRLGDSIDHEQNYIEARLAQEDATLRNILSYAQLQNVVAGRWNWLDAATAAPVTAGASAPAKPATP